MLRLLLPLVAALALPIGVIAHEKPHKVVWMVLNLKQGGGVVVIPTASLAQCNAEGSIVIESRELSLRGKGYECVEGVR
ncbi:hypothetical protein [Prochlorococcus marinus]|uniref:hypothetical protein n=1 Tax=Prochlorococcus marinus TaxID=1219 RepID=UPI0022B59C37|nr:hypothetical protein [Prochlorococcus marinus]